MRCPTLSALTFGFAVTLLSIFTSPTGAQIGVTKKAEEYEQGRLTRCAEGVYRAQHTERFEWKAELEKSYPGRVTDPDDDDEYIEWFNLLASDDGFWYRDKCPTDRIKGFYDRVLRDRRLGEAKAIGRRDFMEYADDELHDDHRRAQRYRPNMDREADRVFDLLDKDEDGVLRPNEMTTRLAKSSYVAADPDLNGRVDKMEYRKYFAAEVDVEIPVVAKRYEEERARRDAERAKREAAIRLRNAEEEEKPFTLDELDEDTGIPKWFTGIDTNEDGQVALHEWRQANGPIPYFLDMDLNRDGLLTLAEYQRFAANKAKMEEEKEEPVPTKKLTEDE